MKKTKCTHFMLIFISLFFALACNKQEKELPIINPTESLKNELKLTDIAEEISYLKLDNSILLPEISNVKKIESGYFVRASSQLFYFGNNGEFKNKIGTQGNGPEEYSRIADFTFDPNSKLIYLLDYKKVHVLTYSGEYKYSFAPPDDKFFEHIYFYGNKLYFPDGFHFSGLKTEWYSTDFKGNILSKKDNAISVTRLGIDYGINLLFDCNNQLYYWNQLNDTIFSIGEKTTPAYLFAQGDYRITETDLKSGENYRARNFWELKNVLGTKHYLIFDYSLKKDKKEIYTFYDKNKQKMYEWAVLENYELKGANAYDNGLLFIPKSYTEIEGVEYLFCWINAFELKAHIESADFKTTTPKYPEKKKQLEQLANSLNENDNPVLMLVKLKK